MNFYICATFQAGDFAERFYLFPPTQPLPGRDLISTHFKWQSDRFGTLSKAERATPFALQPALEWLAFVGRTHQGCGLHPGAGGPRGCLEY